MGGAPDLGNTEKQNLDRQISNYFSRLINVYPNVIFLNYLWLKITVNYDLNLKD